MGDNYPNFKFENFYIMQEVRQLVQQLWPQYERLTCVAIRSVVVICSSIVHRGFRGSETDMIYSSVYFLWQFLKHFFPLKTHSLKI